jgi:hypothetical protein
LTPRQVYEAELRRHLELCRGKVAVPPRELLPPEEEAQCQVLGGHLIHWLSDWGPQLLQERAVLSSLQGWDEEPLICFQSDLPGLVIAREVLGDEPGSVVWGLFSDFESLPNRDHEFMYHVELHSTFIPVSPETLDPEVRRKHPLTGSEGYLYHRDESILGPLFARGAHHLWKWNGRELTLLEEGFETWVS